MMVVNKEATGSQNSSLEVGHWVALSLREGAAPLRCYVGEIQVVDEVGVRITLVDWPSGRAASFDFFAPWGSITSSLVATKEHDLHGFTDDAKRWQDQMGAMGAMGATSKV